MTEPEVKLSELKISHSLRSFEILLIGQKNISTV
jgi:hypothetical protein